MAVTNKNQRLAWMAQELGKLKSNNAIVAEACRIFGIALSTAKAELREVYDHWASFSRENAESDKFKVLEALWTSVDEARTAFNYNAVIAGLREIAKIQGSYAPEKVNLTGQVAVSGAPTASTVRGRLAALMADPKIRAKAAKIGLDLDTIAGVGSDGEATKAPDQAD